MSVNSDKIRSQIIRVKELPTLPEVVNRVLRLVSSPETSAQDLNKIISTDVALSSKILRLANSAFYGLSRQVSTVTEAVVYLGFNMVKGMALSISVFDAFKNHSTHYKYFSREALWRHALAGAIISRRLSKTIKYGEVETIFLGGLLHDIGKIVIDCYYPLEFIRILELAEKENLYILDAEEEILGTNHAQIGFWLAEWWKLPEALTNPVLYHHNPKIYQKDKGVAIVHTANALARQWQLGNSGDERFLEIDPVVLTLLALPPGFSERMLADVNEELDKADIFLALSQQV